MTWLISLRCLFNLVILKKLESKVLSFHVHSSHIVDHVLSTYSDEG